MIRVAVADKDRLVAQLLGRLIDEAQGMRVTRIYTNGPSLSVGLEAGGTDVAVVDPIGLTPMGMEFVLRLRGADPAVRIVVVTSSQSEHDLFSAVRAGARGYISKSADPMEVVAAVRAAQQGAAVLSQERAAQLMDEFARQS